MTALAGEVRDNPVRVLLGSPTGHDPRKSASGCNRTRLSVGHLDWDASFQHLRGYESAKRPLCWQIQQGNTAASLITQLAEPPVGSL